MSSKYIAVTNKDTKESAYKLVEGSFEGVVWNYRNVKFPIYNDKNELNLEEAENIPLSFDFDVFYNPFKKEDLETGEFASEIGDILIEILEDRLENGEIRFNTENRNSNSE